MVTAGVLHLGDTLRLHQLSPKTSAPHRSRRPEGPVRSIWFPLLLLLTMAALLYVLLDARPLRLNLSVFGDGGPELHRLPRLVKAPAAGQSMQPPETAAAQA